MSRRAENECIARDPYLLNEFPFIKVTESWLSYDSNLVLEINGYKSHSFIRTGRKGGGFKLFYFDYISIEVKIHLSVIEDSYKSIFVKASISGIGNMYVASIHRPPKNP